MAVVVSGAIILKQNEQRLVYNKQCTFCGCVDKTPIEVPTPQGSAYLSGYGNCHKCKEPYRVVIKGEWREKHFETNQSLIDLPVKKVMHESPVPVPQKQKQPILNTLWEKPTARVNGQLNGLQLTFGAVFCYFFFTVVLYVVARIIGIENAWLFGKILSGILTFVVVMGNLQGRMKLGLIVVPAASYMIYALVKEF